MPASLASWMFLKPENLTLEPDLFEFVTTFGFYGNRALMA